MNLSDTGRAALRAREGERLTAYRDSVGVLTISVGVTNATNLINITPGMTITAAQSDALFAKAVEGYVQTVRTALTRSVPQPFFDACVSLCYNIGQPGFTRSTVVKLANAGDLKGAAEAMLMWDRPAVIIPRRQGEHDQALLPAYGAVYARRGDHKPVTGSPTLVATATTPKEGFWSWLHDKLSRKTA